MTHIPNRPSKLSRPFFRRNKYDSKPIIASGIGNGIKLICDNCGGGRHITIYGTIKIQTCKDCGKQTEL